MDIQNTLALITGASSGIGAATAQRLARDGARVILLARTQSALESVAAEIRSFGGTAYAYPADLTDPNSVEQVAARIKAEVGLPDILVNSAGIGRWLYADETPPQAVIDMMAAPYFCAFFITRAFLPDLLRRNSGHIVNINSPAAKMPWPGATAYTGARWALMGFTQALRADLYGTRLKVHSIVAGKVTSTYWDHNPGALDRAPTLARIIPDLTPDQVADAVSTAIRHNRSDIVIPTMLRLFYTLHTLVPGLVERLVWSSGWTRQKQSVADKTNNADFANH
ncbi:MAG: SDR family NAD(P)-dependent oxidoreductase [Thermoflexales bacterium]|nr:SDR family NAD(P)-dependent oxidoreductase [Thermoflexales bacterium]